MWSDRTKIALEKKVFRNKKFGDMFLLFICKTSYCQNLRAIEQIPFDLQLLKGGFRGHEGTEQYTIVNEQSCLNFVVNHSVRTLSNGENGHFRRRESK